jgi:hypothetical protein
MDDAQQVTPTRPGSGQQAPAHPTRSPKSRFPGNALQDGELMTKRKVLRARARWDAEPTSGMDDGEKHADEPIAGRALTATQPRRTGFSGGTTRPRGDRHDPDEPHSRTQRVRMPPGSGFPGSVSARIMANGLFADYAGSDRAAWDGRNRHGVAVPAGVCFVRRAGYGRFRDRLVVVR